jgi:DNA-binding SARP family transcriptional activator
MEFRILGPLEVLEHGRALDIRAAKPRALLAVLLLHANRVVSNDQLIESLWGERPPSTGKKALHVHVSHLRKLVGRERILTRPPGYELKVEPGELDLERFDMLASQGELGEALALWRGSALADFAYEPFAQAEIARLDELRLSVLERRIANDLENGRHEDVVGELEALVRDHPARERTRAQLMLALYGSGRQADALGVYAAGRTLLSEELGLEPAQELKDLQRAILEQDPALALAPSRRPATATPAETAPPAAELPREVRKTVTVLFGDLTPSGGALDPESLGRMTGRGFAELLPVLKRHGATVARSLGGAVTGIFGVPSVHEDDALRALRAAAEMRDRLAGLRAELEASWGAWLELRAGVATGEVVTGGEGAEPYVTGGAVQRAIRLQQDARPDTVLIDERTHRLVRDRVDTTSSGEHIALESVLPTKGFESRFDAPLVGRARERRRLHDAFEQALGDRSCQLFTILGAPGVGKSRLVSEFLQDVAPQALVAQGRCLPYGEGITYWPVLEAVRDAASLDDAKSAGKNLALLTTVLADQPDADLVARRLGEVIGLVEQTSGVEETFQAVRVLVEALAQRRPLVLVFDDIHWGEATFLDLVDHVADWVRDAPVLLVCLARPELLEARPQWGGGKLNAVAVSLAPLSEAESMELMDSIEGSAAVDDVARHHIVEAAGGNPLFVEEMLALVLEEGRSEVAFEVPPTIQALLGARLDLLSAGERSVIEAASVEGKVFHEAMVVELAAEPGEVDAHLRALMRKELIRPDRPLFSGERAFGFRHLLIRDAAYESIAKAARASLHERYAGWLELRAGERTLELEEILGYHLEQAFRYRSELGAVDDETRALGRRAAERLGLAGRRALMRSDASAGVNLISRSVALLAPDDPFRVELVPNFRVVQGLADLSWADRVLTEAIEAAATSGNRALAAHALVQRGFLRLYTDRTVVPAELTDVANRAIAVFEELGDELGLARALRLVAQAHYLDRHATACVEVSERALAHARRAGDRFEQREVAEWIAIALLLGSTPAPDGLARCEELLALEWEDSLLPAEIASAAAAFLGMQGRLPEAEALVERSRAKMEEGPERIGLVSVVAIVAGVAWQGHPAATERELWPAYEALKRVGETTHFSTVAHSLANALYLQGRYDEAEQLTAECERASKPNDVHAQTLWRSTRAKILARKGAFDEADRLGREAVAYAAAGDFLPGNADALADLAEVYDLAGKPADAVLALEDAIRLYELKGNLVAAAGCRARATSLGSSV